MTTGSLVGHVGKPVLSQSYPRAVWWKNYGQFGGKSHGQFGGESYIQLPLVFPVVVSPKLWRNPKQQAAPLRCAAKRTSALTGLRL